MIKTVCKHHVSSRLLYCRYAVCSIIEKIPKMAEWLDVLQLYQPNFDYVLVT